MIMSISFNKDLNLNSCELFHPELLSVAGC